MLYNPEWNTKNKKKIMLEAATLIRQHGLAKNIRHDANGGYCIHGAISQAYHNEPYGSDESTKPIMRDIVAYMRSQGIDPLAGAKWTRSDMETRNWTAGLWNNQSERTAEEVIAVLEGAAHAV